MRILIAIILIVVTAFIASIFLPWQWWFVAVVSFFYAVVLQLKPGKSFLAGFGGAGLFWLSMVLKQDIPNAHILSARMSGVFFGNANVLLFIIVNALLGAIVGGLAAWSGGLMNRAFR